MTTGPGAVVYDLQGAQTQHRDRGVARYVTDLANALEDTRPDLMGGYVLNPDLTPPGRIEALVGARKVRRLDELDDIAGARVFHVASPFELSLPLHRLWPVAASRRGMRLVVTLYDVIPDLFPERYLTDPGLRRRYRARRELVRAADHVLAISEATARDAVDTLGLHPDRISVIGAGVANHFGPPTTHAAAAELVRRAVPEITGPYVMYTGGMEPRKNLDGLLAAYARLPEDVRAGWQLVVVGSANELQRNHYRVEAAKLGIEDGRLVLTGHVEEALLVALYQATELYVCPPLYEGFGLPVAEAMACGAPVVVSDTSALQELVPEEARFDPGDPGAIAAAVERGLRDGAYRERLLAWSRRPPTTWADVAARAAAVYDRLLTLPSRATTRSPRIAFVTPLPPQRSGVADYSSRLLEHLVGHRDVDVFVDEHADGRNREPEVPAGADVFRVDDLEAVEGCRGGYDAVVYSIGNSEFHTGALAALRRRPGIVLAHDVRLPELYLHAAHRWAGVPGGFHAAVQESYGGRVPPELGEQGLLSAEEVERSGAYLAREVVALSEGFYPTSEFAAELARLDADRGDIDKIGVLPYCYPDPHTDAPPGDTAGPPLVASFGVVNASKQPDLLIAAFGVIATRVPEATLALVGPVAEDERERLLAMTREAGVGDRVTLTGAVEPATYHDWIRRATVAVQLRAHTNGETSGGIADCLAWGTATVVTRIGTMRELPDDAVVKVSPHAEPDDVGAVVAELLADPARRRRLGEAALAHVRSRGFARAATDLLAVLPAVR